MDFVLTLGSAATATGFLVSMVKFALPSAQSVVIALAALISGEATSFLVTIAQLTPEQSLDRRGITTAAIAGIFAAAGAIGIRAADNAADKTRDKAQP